VGQEPLVSDETNAGAEFIRRLDASTPVKAAFWVKETETGPWYLYIASDQVDDNTIDVAYGEVLRVAREMASPYLDPFHVKLIPTSDPLAQEVLDLHRRYPGTMPTRLGARSFGGFGVEGLYIYPASVPSANP
jgi:hypothetical protein